ncbi:MAG: hypothetical protein Q9191_007025, partial [Dirinaria sp. TL-2023a]
SRDQRLSQAFGLGFSGEDLREVVGLDGGGRGALDGEPVKWEAFEGDIARGWDLLGEVVTAGFV